MWNLSYVDSKKLNLVQTNQKIFFEEDLVMDNAFVIVGLNK